MFDLFKRKTPTVMDALIRTVYGANPPPKSADLERSVTIAHEDLLFEKVPLSEVKRLAGELFKGPIPYSTHDLAVSTALGFFKNPEYVPVLQECQIPARLRVLNWAKDGKVVKPLAQSFEEVLYRVYKPQPLEANENRSVPSYGGSEKTINEAFAVPLEASKDRSGPSSGGIEKTINEAFAAYGRGDYATSLRLLRPLADQGNANAQYNLGNMYMDGQGVPQSDAEAVKWFRRSAVQGFIDAQANLGAMYMDGRGVPQDHVEALRWLHLAADQGDADSQLNLGNLYMKGNGVQQSITEAMKWYRQGADQGQAVAQFNVGLGYASGQGVRQDDVMAHMWFSLSAAKGSQDAARNRDTIEQIMTPALIAEAQKLAREWKPKPERGERDHYEEARRTLNQINQIAHPTAKDLLIARTPPWDRVHPAVINAILDAITDKALLDVFVTSSMNQNLVPQYEQIDTNKNSTVIRLQISHILCQAGRPVIASLTEAVKEKQTVKVERLASLAANNFEPAIALANEIEAYLAMAQLCDLTGKRDECRDWSERGLAEVVKMRSFGEELHLGTLDLLVQIETQFRDYLLICCSDLVGALLKQAKDLAWEHTATIERDGQGLVWAKRSIRFVRGKEEAVIWCQSATITLVRVHFPPTFDDFLELEQWLAQHPNDEENETPSPEIAYYREIQKFVIRMGYFETLVKAEADESSFFACPDFRKRGYLAGEDATVVAGLYLEALYQYEKGYKSLAVKHLKDYASSFGSNKD